MALESPPPVPSDPADQRRHDLMTPLTRMRMRTQLLLRLARTREGADWEKVAADLAAIDADIALIVAQYDADAQNPG